MTRLLKFRYILGFFLLCGCGDQPAQPQTPESESPVENTTAPQASAQKTILFFGDSLTAGYGLELDQAFPALIAQRIDSLGLDYKVVNAGLSGETTAAGRNRLGWILRQPVDVFVLELGANDGLRGIPLAETRANLLAIIEGVRQKYPEVRVVLTGMQLPPNMGPDYTAEFRTLFPEIAREAQTDLIPFLLQDVGGIPELNQSDGIHPTAEGHRILANTVWEVLGPMLAAESATTRS